MRSDHRSGCMSSGLEPSSIIQAAGGIKALRGEEFPSSIREPAPSERLRMAAQGAGWISIIRPMSTASQGTLDLGRGCLGGRRWRMAVRRACTTGDQPSRCTAAEAAVSLPGAELLSYPPRWAVIRAIHSQDDTFQAWRYSRTNVMSGGNLGSWRGNAESFHKSGRRPAIAGWSWTDHADPSARPRPGETRTSALRWRHLRLSCCTPAAGHGYHPQPS